MIVPFTSFTLSSSLPIAMLGTSLCTDALSRVAKFACPRVLDDHKMNEDNQKFRSCCPPDYEISWEKYFENNCPYKFFKDFILTLSFSNKHISFWELTTNCKSYGFKMRTTISMSRTTRFQILVVLRLLTFDSNFATLPKA